MRFSNSEQILADICKEFSQLNWAFVTTVSKLIQDLSNFRKKDSRSSWGRGAVVVEARIYMTYKTFMAVYKCIINILYDVTLKRGRAVTQAVSRRLPTPAARVRSCGICGGQSGSGAGSLRVLRFPLPGIPPIAPHSSPPIHHPGLAQ
jgi:hypothetical protein